MLFIFILLFKWCRKFSLKLLQLAGPLPLLLTSTVKITREGSKAQLRLVPLLTHPRRSLFGLLQLRGWIQREANVDILQAIPSCRYFYSLPHHAFSPSIPQALHALLSLSLPFVLLFMGMSCHCPVHYLPAEAAGHLWRLLP